MATSGDFNLAIDTPTCRRRTCATVAPDFYISYFRDLAALTQSGDADEQTNLDLMARYATERYMPS